MAQESTLFCIDNSLWMRNGDFVPTRFNAQAKAVVMVCQAKLAQNPENTVALMSLADRHVLATTTTSEPRIFTSLKNVQQPQGSINLVSGIRTGQLVLKHRQAKQQKMRMMIFIASPLQDNPRELETLAKKLKKEKVTVDVVLFGEHDHNREMLGLFIDVVSGRDDAASHLLEVRPGSELCSALASSPILASQIGGPVAPSGHPGLGFGDGDPLEDPELAEAIRLSLEEQAQLQERALQQIQQQQLQQEQQQQQIQQLQQQQQQLQQQQQQQLAQIEEEQRQRYELERQQQLEQSQQYQQQQQQQLARIREEQLQQYELERQQYLEQAQQQQQQQLAQMEEEQIQRYELERRQQLEQAQQYQQRQQYHQQQLARIPEEQLQQYELERQQYLEQVQQQQQYHQHQLALTQEEQRQRYELQQAQQYQQQPLQAQQYQQYQPFFDLSQFSVDPMLMFIQRDLARVRRRLSEIEGTESSDDLLDSGMIGRNNMSEEDQLAMALMTAVQASFGEENNVGTPSDDTSQGEGEGEGEDRGDY